MKYLVTCETANCENENIAIEITSNEDELIVICGPCANLITNIVPVDV